MNKRRFTFRFLQIAFVIALLNSHSYAQTWPAVNQLDGLRCVSSEYHLDSSPFAGWTILAGSALQSPVMGFGQPIAISGDAASALNLLISVFEVQADFQPLQTNSSARLSRTIYREMRHGLPVIAGRADIVLNSRGELMRWNLRVHDGWPALDYHAINLPAAAAILADQQRYPNWHVESERSFMAWFPDIRQHVLRPVYWIRIAGTMPHERWEGIIDGSTGEIILDWSGINSETIHGTIQIPYWYPYDFSETQLAPTVHASVTINGTTVITDSQGNFSGEGGNAAELETILQGPYVWAQNDDGADGLMAMTVAAPFAPVEWVWNADAAAIPEMNLFYHTSFIHDWYKILDPDYSALDYPMPAVANYGTHYDNAFWNGYGTYYGSGSQYHNFAMFCDIIYHEYTHGVTDGIYPNGMLPYTDQPGALNEAWSDYIGCTITNDHYCAEWIGGGFNSWFRNLDNDLVYPDNWRGEVHDDSRFVSAALWEIREAVGAEIADSLAHFARYALAETFLDYLIAVLETDDDDGNLANGTPHANLIYYTFGRHGIGPGLDPHFTITDLSYYVDGTGGSSGDGDRFVEAGETVECVFTLHNTADLFPPPAANVQIQVHSDDPSVTITNGNQSTLTLNPGAAFNVTPVQLHYGADASDHWSIIEINVSANDGLSTYATSFEFTVGTPHVLIVKDDPTSDVERFVGAALRSQDIIFDQIDLVENQSLDASYPPLSGMIIWLSGNASGEIFTANDRLLLQNFLANGNRLVLSGQNIADQLVHTSFGQTVLRVGIASESLISMAVTATDTPLQPGEWFLLSGSSGASNQVEETSFIPQGTTRPIATYGRSPGTSIAAVEFAEGKGLLFGFGIEAISGMAEGSTGIAAFMDRLYAWADDVIPTEAHSIPETTIPQEWQLGPAYPNPFNGQVNISYALPTASNATLIIYDLMGRVVESRALSGTQGTYSWAPHSASGIYFAQLKWNDGHSEPIKLQFLK
ncbi:MAG: T9SS type A sorting domain-containing protein [Calditrichota bacterium]